MEWKYLRIAGWRYNILWSWLKISPICWGGANHPPWHSFHVNESEARPELEFAADPASIPEVVRDAPLEPFNNAIVALFRRPVLI